MRPLVILLGNSRSVQLRARIREREPVSGVERESLYRALSSNGNPRLSTLFAVAKAVGLKLTVEAA